MTPDQARDYVWATHYNSGGSTAQGAIAAIPLGPVLGLTGGVLKTAYKPFVGSIGDEAVRAAFERRGARGLPKPPGKPSETSEVACATSNYTDRAPIWSNSTTRGV